MLILSEENEKLKGTKYRLPKDIYAIFNNIVKTSLPSKDTVYVKAKNVVEDKGVVTMEWLKNMKHFFAIHQNESDPEFLKMGGYDVKTWVDTKLELITGMCPKTPKKKNPTKPRQGTSALAGMHGDHQSSSFDIGKNLLSGLIPTYESKNNGKILIITEEQLKEVSKYLY